MNKTKKYTNPVITDKTIDVLMMEYQNIHERVFRQIAQYDDTNVKMMMLIGVLLFFGISYYNSRDDYLFLFVNIMFVFILPIIATCSLLLSLADLVKVMILGDYLKIIENKINTILSEQAVIYNFPRRKVLDWEYWRIKYGHVKGISSLSEISFSLIVVTLIVFVSYFVAKIRLNYLLSNTPNYNLLVFFQVSYYFFVVLFITIFIVSLIVFKRRRKKTNKNSRKDKPKYG